MDVEAALKKLFAEMQRLNNRVDSRLEAVQKEMKKVATNSLLVVEQVTAHGDVLERLSKTVNQMVLGRAGGSEAEGEESSGGDSGASSWLRCGRWHRGARLP